MEDGEDKFIGRPVRMIDSFLRHNAKAYLSEFAKRLPSGYAHTYAGSVSIFHPENPNPNLPSMLVATGWHGDEEAATLGLMDFVGYDDSKFFAKNINISYMPLVSVEGNMMGMRNNIRSQDPNYAEPENRKLIQSVIEPSSEAQGLFDNLDLVLRLARNGYYTMHEDMRNRYGGAYIYYAGDDDALPFTLVNELEQWMEVSDSNTIIETHKKGSFESFMHDQGVPEVVCTETIACQQCNVPERVRRIAHVNCLRIYCEHIVALGT
jgi:hypothetical protein